MTNMATYQIVRAQEVPVIQLHSQHRVLIEMCQNINGDSYIIVDWGILCIEAEFRNFPSKYPSETSFIKIFNQQKRKFEKMAWGKRTKIDPQQ